MPVPHARAEVIGDIYIKADGSIQPRNAPIDVMGDVYVLYEDVVDGSIIIKKEGIVFDGDGYRLRGSGEFESRGVVLSGVEDVHVKNVVVDGFYYGLYVESSERNYISYCTFLNNEFAIYIGLSSSYNTIFYNIIYDGSARSSSLNNWYIGFEGNYWGEHEFVDVYSGPYQNMLGSDGIVDLPYFVDEENIDGYPLMGNISSFSINSPQGMLNLLYVSNYSISSVLYDTLNSALVFSVKEVDEGGGFCRVAIPKSLIETELLVSLGDGNGEPLSPNYEAMENSTHIWIYFAFHSETQQIEIFFDAAQPDNGPTNGETPSDNETQRDVTPPSIAEVYQNPGLEDVFPGDEVQVFTHVLDDSSGVRNVTLKYVAQNNEQTLSMYHEEGSRYSTSIPSYRANVEVSYVVEAFDMESNKAESGQYQYTVNVRKVDYTKYYPYFGVVLLIVLGFGAYLNYRKREKEKIYTIEDFD